MTHCPFTSCYLRFLLKRAFVQKTEVPRSLDSFAANLEQNYLSTFHNDYGHHHHHSHSSGGSSNGNAQLLSSFSSCPPPLTDIITPQHHHHDDDDDKRGTFLLFFLNAHLRPQHRRNQKTIINFHHPELFKKICIKTKSICLIGPFLLHHHHHRLR